MKIADIYQTSQFALSFEVYPPKTEAGHNALLAAVEELAAFSPGFISCTYGAGGSTRDQTLDIVSEIVHKYPIGTTAHLTCVGSTVEQLCSVLQEASERGVHNIMALRGDPPQGEESFQKVEGGLSYANELVALIRERFPNFGIGVAGYPETHQEAPSPEIDLQNLKCKVDAGADAIFTQLFYENADFFRFRERCAEMGITKPIIPGILPIVSYPQIQRITNLCKAKIPAQLQSDLEKCDGNRDAEMEVGIAYATRQCAGLLDAGVPGIHFYVLNRAAATSAILKNLSIEPGKNQAG